MIQTRSRPWHHRSVEKTTVYLPLRLRLAIKRVAQRRGVSEAEVIRDAIRSAVGGERPRPRGALFASGTRTASQSDDHMVGFGEQ